MFPDPLFDWVHEIGISPLLVWIILPVLSVAFTHLLVSRAYGKGSAEWKALRKDRTENYYWPIFLLGGTAAAFVLIGNLDLELQANFAELGFSYPKFNWLINSELIFPISALVALGIALFSAVRFTKKQIPLWLVGSRWVLLTKALLVSTPMGIWIIPTLVRITNHFWAFYQLGISKWIPPELYHPDRAYGLDWLRELIQIELVLLVIFSFMPLVMMMQIKNLKRVNLYTLLSASGLVVIVFVILPVVLGVDQKFEAINNYWFERTSLELAPYFDFANLNDSLEVAKASALEQRLASIGQMPNSLGSVPFVQIALSAAGNILGIGYESLASLLGFDLTKLFSRWNKGGKEQKPEGLKGRKKSKKRKAKKT